MSKDELSAMIFIQNVPVDVDIERKQAQAAIGITKNRPHSWNATARPRRRPHSNAADVLCGMLHGLSKVTRQHLNCEQTT